MSVLQPMRFVDGEPMLMAGLRRRHTFADAVRDIPAQWREFVQLGEIPSRVNAIEYGVDCGADTDGFDYMCAAHVAEFGSLPAHFDRIRLPAVRYAVFEHATHIATLHATWQAIVYEWLPNSQFSSANTPDFERYDARFDPQTGLGGLEIWIGVVSR